jgi:hypothetical protein
MRKVNHKLLHIIQAAFGILTILAMSLASTGCEVVINPKTIVGSGAIKEYPLSFTGFEQLTVSGPIPTQIFQSERAYVSVKVNENILPYVQVNQIVDLLRINLDPSVNYRNLDIMVTVGMPKLRALGVSLAGKCTLNTFNSKDFVEISVSAASNLEIKGLNAGTFSLFLTSASSTSGTLNAEEGRMTISGASRLNLKGQCSDAFISASAASQANMADYWVNNADIFCSGVSSASINAGGKLNIDLSGVSSLIYGGSPVLGTVRVAAGSTLSRR